MKNEQEFFKYKKLLIFGDEGTGKSTFCHRLEKNEFKEIEPSKESNIISNLI